MNEKFLTADKLPRGVCGDSAGRQTGKKAKTEETPIKKYAEDLVAEIKNDFISRREKRAAYEKQWDLNLSFFKGEQYKTIDPKGELTDEGKDYLWQGREVYNHIAPIVEARLSKFLRVRPSLAVRPENSDADEITNARLAEKIINSAFTDAGVYGEVYSATRWSETCGSGFLKIVWNPKGGKKIGTTEDGEVFEGEISVKALSPYVIFPEDLETESLEDQKSVIEAVLLPEADIYSVYGVKVGADDIEYSSSAESDVRLVISKYVRPTDNFPEGRLTVISCGELLYDGELPYINQRNGKRGYPFIKETTSEPVGEFFGRSVVERLIPVQRAYNAVKNRKHEFMNRITMGVISVEDGSVDVDDLAEDGLCPGKVLVYRQGSAPPEMMNETTLPDVFDKEEEALLKEFVILGGVSDVLSSKSDAGVSSGSALEILKEQENEKLLYAAENVRNVYRLTAEKILRLYRQFITGVRAIRDVTDEEKMKFFYVDKKAVASDEVYLISDNELFYSPAEKREMMLKLYSSGILTGEDGAVPAAVKERLLSGLGYRDLSAGRGICALQQDKASWENPYIKAEEVEPEIVDDDSVHIEEHTRYYLSEIENMSKSERENVLYHIGRHKKNIVKN